MRCGYTENKARVGTPQYNSTVPYCTKYMAVGLAGLLAGVLGLVQAHVTTPFGRVAEGCTLEVPHGTLVEEAADGVALYHPAHGSWQHRTPAHCGALASPSPHAAASNGSAPITCTSLPCNNWIDNAGWQQPDGATPIGGFSSKYIVPATPRTRGPGRAFQGVEAGTMSAHPVCCLC